MIEDLPLTIISVGIDKKFIRSHYPDWNVFNAAWTFITERFDNFIEAHLETGRKGMMIIDKNSKMPDKQVATIVNLEE